MSTKATKLLALLLVFLLAAVCVPLTASASSNLYYGRNKLATMTNGDNLVAAYDTIRDGVKVKNPSISLVKYGLTMNELTKVVELYRYDHPEHYWLPNSFRRGYYSSNPSITTSIKFDYLTGFENSAFDAAVAELLTVTEGKTTEYNKALALHDALVKHISYDLTATNAHNAYGAIVDKRAVCDGYSKAYQYLLQCVGIQSYIVSGTSKGQNHAWNLVRLDGKYYYTDVTWDDPTVGGTNEITKPVFHSYFNINTSKLLEDHIIKDTYGILPDCTEESTICNKHTQLFEYTVEKVAEAFKVLAGQAVADIYFTGTDDNFNEWIKANYSAVLNKIGVWGYINWINDGHEHYIAVTPEPDIASANLSIIKPVGNAAPNYTVTSDESDKYIGIVSWYDGASRLGPTDIFEFGKTYTAKIEFDAQFGYEFLTDAIFTVNGNATDSYGEIFEREIEFTVTSAFGDQTDDGLLNSADLIEFKKMLLHNSSDNTNDMNADGEVNLLDFVRLKKFIAGSDVKLGQP